MFILWRRDGEFFAGKTMLDISSPYLSFLKSNRHDLCPATPGDPISKVVTRVQDDGPFLTHALWQNRFLPRYPFSGPEKLDMGNPNVCNVCGLREWRPNYPP